MIRRRVFGLTLAAFLAGLACRAQPQPAETVARYGAALERGDHAAAYAQLSAEYRARVSFDQFRRQMSAAPADTRVSGRTLKEAAQASAGRAEVRLGTEERAALVREEGAWRLQSPPADAYGQDTPRAALRAFVRAVEARRYDVLVELAPARVRQDVTAEKLRSYWSGLGAERTRTLLTGLRLALERPIIEEGDQAYVALEDRQIRLVRESGLWRVDSPE